MLLRVQNLDGKKSVLKKMNGWSSVFRSWEAQLGELAMTERSRLHLDHFLNMVEVIIFQYKLLNRSKRLVMATLALENYRNFAMFCQMDGAPNSISLRRVQLLKRYVVLRNILFFPCRFLPSGMEGTHSLRSPLLVVQKDSGEKSV